MKDAQVTRRRSRALSGPAWLILGLALAVSAPNIVWSQQSAPFPGEPQLQVRVFALKYANASDIGDSLDQLLSKESDDHLRIVPDKRTNSVIIMGTPETMKLAQELVEAMDMPETSQDLEVRIFPLQKLRADSAGVRQVLEVAAPPDVSLAFDKQRNLVVASGSREGLAAVEAVLEQLKGAEAELDRPEDKDEAGPSEVQIRIVWLVSGLETSAASNPPDDLSQVVRELSIIGVKNPRQVAQVIINTVDINRGFQARGSAKLDQPCDLAIQGRLVRGESPLGTGRRWALEMSIDVEQKARTSDGDGAKARRELCSLQSTISAPFGHSVVLGATPIDELTSVFVVQVVPKDQS